MKRIFTILLCALLSFAFAACGNKKPSPSEAEVGPLSDDDILGSLLFSAFAVRYPGVDALSLSGDRAGSAEYNSKAPSKEGIRFAFELGERVSYILNTGETAGSARVFLCEHRPFVEYRKADLASLSVFSEEKPAEGTVSGSFTLDPAACAKGNYDLLFVFNDWIVATTIIRVYGEGELSSLSDRELDALGK